VAGTVGDTPGAAPIQPGTLFEVGSNTKSFTAAVILQLAAETRLGLDDRLDRWLPQYPAWGEVTLRRLLHMTNPIPDYAGTPAVLRTRRPCAAAAAGSPAPAARSRPRSRARSAPAGSVALSGAR
jgi:CubicO group peptidase (beta-lactamase class C family)